MQVSGDRSILNKRSGGQAGFCSELTCLLIPAIIVVSGDRSILNKRSGGQAGFCSRSPPPVHWFVSQPVITARSSRPEACAPPFRSDLGFETAPVGGRLGGQNSTSLAEGFLAATENPLICELCRLVPKAYRSEIKSRYPDLSDNLISMTENLGVESKVRPWICRAPEVHSGCYFPESVSRLPGSVISQY